jgi:hypothetical protein
VARRLEDVHTALGTSFFQGVDTGRTDVLLFARESDFRGVAPKDTGGFYTGEAGGLLVFPVDDELEWVEQVAAHELAHRFMHRLAIPVPAWLNEGFANYAGSLAIVEDRAVFDTAELHGGYVYFHDPIPLSTMLATSYGGFHAGDRTAHYMTAWMMLRHLLARPGGDPKQRFRQLVERIGKAPGSPEAHAHAIEETFGVALAALEAEIVALHKSIFHGVGQPRSRAAVAVRFPTRSDPPMRVTPAPSGAVKALCAKLRDARPR